MDTNLVLGRILPECFPKIFSPNEDQPLDIKASRRLFAKITKVINANTGMNMSVAEVAKGYRFSIPD